ncbi:MAG: GAF domain-containing protein [Archangium sp.]|nr:GAF domain-containing protein [Archangium sp.]
MFPPALSGIDGSKAGRLIEIIQELSLARSLEAVMAIVRTAARELTGADGATFVLRDGGNCYYADEDAISPLWKGRRFPLTACISGWAMLNKQSVAIEDIYLDARIPHDAYRPTFVKSLVMTPIRASAPVGSIGTYWARTRVAPPEEIRLLQALANSTSIAIENVELVNDLERRVRERTAQLEAANRELKSFSYSVSHDLRAPLRAIDGYSQWLMDDEGEKLAGDSKNALVRIRESAAHMGQLIEALLGLAQLSQSALTFRRVDVGAVARGVVETLGRAHPERVVEVSIQEGLIVEADEALMRVLMTNLLGNAWKFTRHTPNGRIEVLSQPVGDRVEYVVRDNGAGFDMAHSAKLFGAFQRLHRVDEFEGTGIGLATVAQVVARHGGSIRAEGKPGLGAAFLFTLGAPVIPSGLPS